MKIAPHHVESLDVFRGLTVAAMILVNNPGDWSAVFQPLLHAYWTGWTLADLVFPWFIFTMGVAMPFAFARRRATAHAPKQLYRRIVQRGALLIVLGLMLNAVAAWPTVAPLRYPGVLQRIALAYLVAAPIVLQFDVAGWAIAAAALLLAHWALLALVPFGGFPAGTVSPEHSLAGYVDALVFGQHALTAPIDPEGLLGTLTAAGTALAGALAGEMLRRTGSDMARVRRLASRGSAAVVLGLIWATVWPVSKPLWTGSFVLVTCGLGALALALVYVVVDVWQLRAWAQPLLWLGVNPLAIYFLSEAVGHLTTTAKSRIYWTLLEPLMVRTPELASLLFGLAYVFLWIGVAGVLYRRHIRVQV